MSNSRIETMETHDKKTCMDRDVGGLVLKEHKIIIQIPRATLKNKPNLLIRRENQDKKTWWTSFHLKLINKLPDLKQLILDKPRGILLDA